MYIYILDATEKMNIKMRFFGVMILLTSLNFCGCNNTSPSTLVDGQADTLVKTEGYSKVEKTITIEVKDDKTEILKLIKNVLIWSDSKDAIILLPAFADENDSLYIGFDMTLLNQNLKKLKDTDFFAVEFIENYKQIILTLDNKITANELEYGPWLVGDMPPFNFASDANPWCLCQDNLEWERVQIEHYNGNQYLWNWGELEPEFDEGWKEFRYKFEIIKEDSKWKIKSLEGFNINEIE